jgi:uncharacterized membrane protein YphA (DoxX/SURF4 family)
MPIIGDSLSGLQPYPVLWSVQVIALKNKETARLLRLFSIIFPGGGAGIGLLLLRAAVGLIAIMQGVVCLFGRDSPTFWPCVVGLLAFASGVALLLGLLTPVACIVVGLCNVSVALLWLPASLPNLFADHLSPLFLVIMAAGLVLTGPGAFSFDARLFGRREIIIPPVARPPQS